MSVLLHDEKGLLDHREKEAVASAAAAAFVACGRRGAVEVSFVDPNDMRALNAQHRQVDRVTDVLSFPTAEKGALPPDGHYGDIVICPARAQAQAEEYGQSRMRELAFLTAHGMLHLFGFDHETQGEEREMRRLQRMIMERMEGL